MSGTFRNTPVARAVALALVIASCGVAPAYAQEQDQQDEVREVVVTGSRIIRE